MRHSDGICTISHVVVGGESELGWAREGRRVRRQGIRSSPSAYSRRTRPDSFRRSSLASKNRGIPIAANAKSVLSPQSRRKPSQTWTTPEVRPTKAWRREAERVRSVKVPITVSGVTVVLVIALRVTLLHFHQSSDLRVRLVPRERRQQRAVRRELVAPQRRVRGERR